MFTQFQNISIAVKHYLILSHFVIDGLSADSKFLSRLTLIVTVPLQCGNDDVPFRRSHRLTAARIAFRDIQMLGVDFIFMTPCNGSPDDTH